MPKLLILFLMIIDARATENDSPSNHPIYFNCTHADSRPAAMCIRKDKSTHGKDVYFVAAAAYVRALNQFNCEVVPVKEKPSVEIGCCGTYFNLDLFNSLPYKEVEYDDFWKNCTTMLPG